MKNWCKKGTSFLLICFMVLSLLGNNFVYATQADLSDGLEQTEQIQEDAEEVTTAERTIQDGAITEVANEEETIQDAVTTEVTTTEQTVSTEDAAGSETAEENDSEELLSKKTGSAVEDTVALTGDGTEGNPYQIASAADFPSEINADEYYCLTMDIVLSEGQQIETLAGMLDGKGHTVTLADKPLANTVSGIIQNLGVASAEAISLSEDYSGSMAVTLTGTIQNCYSMADITTSGYNELGGLVGTLSTNAVIQNSYHAGTISAMFSGGIAAAGLVETAAISNCCYVYGSNPVSYGTKYQKNNCVKKTTTELTAGEANELLNTDLPSTGFYWVSPENSSINNGYPVLKEGDLPTDSVDKTSLNNTIESVKSLVESEYTVESWTALQTALTAAEAENESEESTKATVSTALTNLVNAISALEKKKPTEAVALPEDTSEIIYISTQAQLESISASENKYYVLQNDITLDSWYMNTYSFSGVLDGQGHSITYNGGFTALFNEISANGIVQNIHFTGKAGTSSQDGPVCRTLKGTIINCYSDVTGDNACGFAKTLDGGQIVNSYSVSSGKIAVLFKAYNSGNLINTYWQEYLTNPAEIPSSALNNSYAMSETDMKSLDFVELLNENRGEYGIKWGQSSTGYPYFGENQEYSPENEAFTNKYEVTFNPYGSEDAVSVKNQELIVSPDAVDSFYCAGTLGLNGVSEDSNIVWTCSETTPEECIMTGTATGGELYVYSEGKTCITATENKADGTSEKVAVVYVTATTKTISDIQLWIDEENVTNGTCTVEGSEWKSIQVKAKYTDSDEYVPVAYSRFTYTVSDSDMVQNTEGSRSFYFKQTGTATITVTSITNPDIKATVEVTSTYVPVESVTQTIEENIVIHGRNANSSEKNGMVYLPDYSGVVIKPENASNRNNYTITSSNPEVGNYIVNMVHGYVPYKAGTTTYTVSLTDTNPTTNETNVVTNDRTVTYTYRNPLTSVTMDKTVLEVENYSETLLDLKYNGECSSDGYGVTETELVWTYDKENVVKIERKENGRWIREENAPDNGYYLAGTDYYIYALSEGTVTAIGTPVDDTHEIEPITISITVIPADTPAPDVQAMMNKGLDGATAYLQREYPESYQYGYEWILYTLLRADKEVSQIQMSAYYNSVVKEIKTWKETQKPTDVERVSLAIAILGKDITNVEGVNLASMIYNSSKLGDGANELIYALLALDAKQTVIPESAKWSRQQMIDALLTFQNENGGFGLMDNSSVSVDVTAMALQALAPYKEEQKVGNAIKKGLTYLKNEQSADCGFGTAESTAQVLIALCTLEMDALDVSEGFGNSYNNMITNLNQYYLENPSGFVHTIGKSVPDSMATIQVMQAYTAYQRFREGKTSYWDLVGFETQNELKSYAINFENNQYSLYATEQLAVKVNCSDAEDKVIEYKSSDETVVTVSNQGVLEGQKAGNAVVTAISASGASATVSVTVKTPKIKLSTTKGKLQVKKSTSALKVVEKLDTDKVTKWESSNKKVATVNSKGKITAKKTGTATITVTMKSGATANCKVTVQKKAVKSGVKFKKSTYKLYATATLNTGCKLTNSFDMVKSYSSSNKKVVTVSKTGVLKGKKPGTAKITVTTQNGAKATVKVTVKKPSVKLTKKNIKLKAGNKTDVLRIKKKIETDSVKKWKSSNSKIVSVDKNGNLTAKKKGTATITVTMKSGATAKCKVTVKNK